MHRDTAQCYCNLAVVYFQRKSNHQEAIKCQEKVCVIMERTLGMDHPLTAHAYENMAILLQELGQPQQAAAMMNRTIKLHRLIFGDDFLGISALRIKASVVLQEA